jgi:hypothetical protein
MPLACRSWVRARCLHHARPRRPVGRRQRPVLDWLRAVRARSGSRAAPARPERRSPIPVALTVITRARCPLRPANPGRNRSRRSRWRLADTRHTSTPVFPVSPRRAASGTAATIVALFAPLLPAHPRANRWSRSVRDHYSPPRSTRSAPAVSRTTRLLLMEAERSANVSQITVERNARQESAADAKGQRARGGMMSRVRAGALSSPAARSRAVASAASCPCASDRKTGIVWTSLR